MMATMPATSPSQDVARRLMDDGYVVVTGMMTPDGARARPRRPGPGAAHHPDRAELLRGLRHPADLRAVRQDPRVRRARHRPAAARRPGPGAGPLPAQRPGRHLHRAGREGAGPAPGRRHLPGARAASAAGGQHHVAARRVHRPERGDQVHPRQPPVGTGEAAGSGRSGGDGRDVTRIGPVLPGQPLARGRREPDLPAAARRDPGVRGRVAAATGEPLPGRSPGCRPRVAGTAAGTARLQHLPAVRGVRRRQAPAPGAVGRFVGKEAVTGPIAWRRPSPSARRDPPGRDNFRPGPRRRSGAGDRRTRSDWRRAVPGRRTCPRPRCPSRRWRS